MFKSSQGSVSFDFAQGKSRAKCTYKVLIMSFCYENVFASSHAARTVYACTVMAVISRAAECEWRRRALPGASLCTRIRRTRRGVIMHAHQERAVGGQWVVKNLNKKRGGTMTRARIQILSSKCPPLWLEIYRLATGATPSHRTTPQSFPQGRGP